MAEETLAPANPALDEFERYYAEKLWEWIPPIYRHEDGLAERRTSCGRWSKSSPDKPPSRGAASTAVGQRVHSHLRRLGDPLHRRAPRHAAGRQSQSPRPPRGCGADAFLPAAKRHARRHGGAHPGHHRLGRRGRRKLQAARRARHRLDPEPEPFAGPITHTPPGGTADLHADRISDVITGRSTTSRTRPTSAGCADSRDVTTFPSSTSISTGFASLR